MLTDSTYSCKVSDKIVIENGIIKGAKVPVKIDHDNYGELVLEKFKSQPKYVGQIDGITGEKITFAEMLEKSVKCAIWLREQDVNLGDVIGICTHNRMDTYVPCFASLYIGAVWNAWWDTELTKEVAKHFLELTKPKFVFATDRTAEVVLEAIAECNANTRIVIFGKYQNHLSLDDILSATSSHKVSEFRCTILRSREDPAVIIYTSGSTGLPKGVIYSHRTLFYSIDYMKTIGPVEDPITLLFSPLCWVTGFLTMFRGAVMPNHRIIYPDFEEEKCLQLIEKFKANWLLLGSTAACSLMKHPALFTYDTSSVKWCFVGGSALKSDAQKSLSQVFPHTTIVQMYGSTELGGMGLIQDEDCPPGCCGRAVQNVIFKIVDPETGRILGPNETGEICLKAPYLMSGYHNNPEATSEVIDSEGWLHTGDLVYYDEQAHVFFVDRMKELIKYRGHHVSPTMIEQLLLTCSAIHEVAVVGTVNDTNDEVPIAFVVKKFGAEITEEEIQKIVAEAFPDYMKLRGGVKFLDELPHTPSNKVAKTILKKLAQSIVS